MTDRDEIIRLAKEVGLTVEERLGRPYALLNENTFWQFNDMLERFFTRAYEAGSAAERETCLLIVEYCAKHGLDLSTAADAIRSRGVK